ncbi:SynChlorMet cassette protein ScmD [Candidatus Fermentibacteria bacterium]|nr:SynChlorMet cassette protein ScmD [Candidatus Fermentibacteria bacterium]
MELDHYLEANPAVVMREEQDNCAVLFDPETGAGFGLNPVGVFVWKHLDGYHRMDDILGAMHREFAQVPGDAEAHLKELVHALVDKGLVGKVMRQR